MAEDTEVAPEIDLNAPVEPEQQETTPEPVQATPADPVETPPARQPVQFQEQYQPPERITRARANAARLDETLGTGGALRDLIEDIAGTTEQIDRENHRLRQSVEQQGRIVDGVGYWQEHDANPDNANYPSSQARKDFLAVRNEVRTDPIYSALPATVRDTAIEVAARERFNARAASKRAAARDDTEQPAAPARQVGSTRTIPRNARQAPAPPQKKKTVDEMLQSGVFPSDIEQRVTNELSDFGPTVGVR